MDPAERHPLLIRAPGATLAGVLHAAGGRDAAVLILPGAPQTRLGAHRGFVMLADALAAAGYPVLRFDRRGLGDSDGEDPGFRHIAGDIDAAAQALRTACPGLSRLIGLGLCDGAAALALDPAGFDGLILLNPWTRDSDRAGAMPPRAAIAARYRERARPLALAGRLLRGEIDLRRAIRGVARMIVPEPPPQTARRMADALGRYEGTVQVVLGGRDATGLAFQALWQSPMFRAAADRPGRKVLTIPGAGHTFAGRAASEALASACVSAVRAMTGGAR